MRKYPESLVVIKMQDKIFHNSQVSKNTLNWSNLILKGLWRKSYGVGHTPDYFTLLSAGLSTGEKVICCRTDHSLTCKFHSRIYSPTKWHIKEKKKLYLIICISILERELQELMTETKHTLPAHVYRTFITMPEGCAKCFKYIISFHSSTFASDYR